MRGREETFRGNRVLGGGLLDLAVMRTIDL